MLLEQPISFSNREIKVKLNESCRNFGKELVILFHRSAAAPWGHVASIIKKSPTGDSLSFGSTPTTVSTGTQERRTHVLSLKEQDTHTVKFQQAFYLQTNYFTHFKTNPLTFKYPHKTFTLPNLLYLQPYNLHNKPNHILHLELFFELSFLNCYLHIRCLFHLV